MHNHGHITECRAELLNIHFTQQRPVPRPHTPLPFRHSLLANGVSNAKMISRLESIRPQRDARTYFSQLRGLFEDNRFMSVLAESNRRG